MISATQSNAKTAARAPGEALSRLVSPSGTAQRAYADQVRRSGCAALRCVVVVCGRAAVRTGSVCARPQLPATGMHVQLLVDQQRVETLFGALIESADKRDDGQDEGYGAGRLSALAVAVITRHIPAAKQLLDAGADPSLTDGTGMSPYVRALRDHANKKGDVRQAQVGRPPPSTSES